jgi:tetratricopeptide (TPR) repeat protein
MLAYHYSKSERKEKACHYLKLSGDKAARNESLKEAFRFYEQALNLLKTELETEENKAERLKVILSMAPSMRVLGYPEDSEGILHEGGSLANELGDSRILARMYGWTGMYHMQKGAPLVAMQHQENAFLEAEQTGDVSIIAPTAWQLCVSLASIQDGPRCIEVFQRVIPLFEQTGTTYESFGTPLIVYPILLGMYGFVLGSQGDFSQGKALLNQAYRVAQEISHRYTTGWLCCWQAAVCAKQGDAQNGIRYSRESLQYFEESQAILFLPIALATSGYAHYLANDLESARSQVEKGLQLQRELGSMFWFSIHYLYLALIHIASGDYDGGRTLAEEAVGISVKIGAKHLEGQSKALLGRITTKVDNSRSAEAETLIMEAIQIFEELKERPDIAVAFLYLGEIYSDSGQRDKSFETIKKAESMFQEMGMDYWLAKAQKALAIL